jgi:hypothetical protein
MQQHALPITLGQQRHAAIGHQRQGRQGRARQSIGVAAHPLGAQTQGSGGLQQVGYGDVFALRAAQRMPQLGRVASAVMQARQHAQRLQCS